MLDRHTSNARNTGWIPGLVLFVFALGGVLAALRGKYLLSGVFALYFFGYFIIRMPYLLDEPFLRIPDRARRIGYVAMLAALVFLAAFYIIRK